MDVPTDYLQRTQVRVELTGDDVEQADGAPDEQQLRRYVPDARAEFETEAPGARGLEPDAVRLRPTARIEVHISFSLTAAEYTPWRRGPA
jgi:hypothetical protein